MVRRGVGGTAARGGSSSSSSSRADWKSSRTQSADTSLATTKSAKSSTDNSSSMSSPGGRGSVSPIMKKPSRGSTRSTQWRGRGEARGHHHHYHGRGGGGHVITTDPNPNFTSEDFPALPACRGGHHGGTPNKNGKNRSADKDKNHYNVEMSDMTAADDSGVSSGSSGKHTPTPDGEVVPVVQGSSVTSKTTGKSEKIYDSTPYFKKKGSVGRGGSTTGGGGFGKAPKNGESPMKGTERGGTTERPPRNIRVRINTQTAPSSAAPSPKKKTINANAANTAPSFMKLAKGGQKIAERRGAAPRNTHQNTISAPPDDKENSTPKNKDLLENGAPEHASEYEFGVVVEEKKKEEMKMTPPQSSNSSSSTNSHCIFNATDVPKIILGPNGEMSNIPESMLTDQYGMAAMLPILDIVKNRSRGDLRMNGGHEMMMEGLDEEQMRERIENENIEMTTIGFDLNELGVPMKTQELNEKPVWETFAGPFGSSPLNPTSMGLTTNQIPSVYYTATTLSNSFDMLLNIPDKFGLHELFYIFYNFPKEIWQLNAARELQYRGWRFNIKERLWVLRMLNGTDDYNSSAAVAQNPFTQPQPNQEDVMVGNFEIYDVEKARICSSQLVLRRSDFEVPAWEQKNPDAYQKMIQKVVPPAMLWGPREDRKNHGFIQEISGIMPNFSARHRLAPLTIPKPSAAVGAPLPSSQQPQQSTEASNRRLLSFIDSPDVTASFENPFGGGGVSSSINSEDHIRQQMFAAILQRMQLAQQNQFQNQFGSSNGSGSGRGGSAPPPPVPSSQIPVAPPPKMASFSSNYF